MRWKQFIGMCCYPLIQFDMVKVEFCNILMLHLQPYQDGCVEEHQGMTMGLVLQLAHKSLEFFTLKEPLYNHFIMRKLEAQKIQMTCLRSYNLLVISSKYQYVVLFFTLYSLSCYILNFLSEK